MKSILSATVVAGVMTFASHQAFADDTTIVVEPEVHSWIMEQPDTASITYKSDVTVGEVLPDDIQIMEVPNHTKYRYAIVNKHRVLIDGGTRKVIAEY